jgi:hypothetical protein
MLLTWNSRDPSATLPLHFNSFFFLRLFMLLFCFHLFFFFFGRHQPAYIPTNVLSRNPLPLHPQLP